MRSESYYRGYKVGHIEGFDGWPHAGLFADAEFADGYHRGYEAGRATREYRKAHDMTTFRNPAHRARVREGR